MAGYSRQSTADITASAVVKAAPINAEFNDILAALHLVVDIITMVHLLRVHT